MHCQTPRASGPTTVPLALIVTLTHPAPLVVQRLVVPVQKEFEFLPAPQPVFRAASQTSIPCGVSTTLEWYSPAPVFEALGIVPYRCLWSDSEWGEVSTPAIAFTSYRARCRVPVASTQHNAQVQLQDPLGYIAATLPTFRYYRTLEGTWWLPEGRVVEPEGELYFQTNGDPIEESAYGTPMPGVTIECLFGRVASAPLSVEPDGVTCGVPALQEGEYPVSLRYDRAFSASPEMVTLRRRLGTPEAEAERAPQRPPRALRIELVSLEPRSGPLEGGTIVEVHLKGSLPVPCRVFCHFGARVLEAALVMAIEKDP